MNFWKYLHPLLKTDNDSRYSTANYAVLKSLADSLSDAERDTLSKKIQLIFETATGEYLDEYGKWFGVSRYPNEDDNDYRERIKYYLLIPRSTVRGIIEGIQYYLNDTKAQISIYEPWKNIFYLNKSNLNGDDHLPGYYYRYAIIDVHIDRPMSQAIYDAIQAFKPAGVKFYVTINPAYSSDNTAEVLADLQVRSMNVITQKYGFTYASKIPITFADRADTLVPITDYFKTNNSALNGKDVLAGSPLHNVTYWNSLKTSDSQYKDVPVNLLTGTSNDTTSGTIPQGGLAVPTNMQDIPVTPGQVFVARINIPSPTTINLTVGVDVRSNGAFKQTFVGDTIRAGKTGSSVVAFVIPPNIDTARWWGPRATASAASATTVYWSEEKLEQGTVASPWSPNPADPEYYEATDIQRSIISNNNYPYVTLPSISGVNMIDGQLSIYNLLTAKYAGLLNTYAGSTSYDKVKSLISDTNVSLGIIVNTDSPISINGTNISKGKQSVIIDKSSVVYTASDIYIPVVATGTSDTNMHYLVANISVYKQIPGLGMNLVSQQMDTTISNA